jgi:hypothetical protein
VLTIQQQLARRAKCARLLIAAFFVLFLSLIAWQRFDPSVGIPKVILICVCVACFFAQAALSRTLRCPRCGNRFGAGAVLGKELRVCPHCGTGLGRP